MLRLGSVAFINSLPVDLGLLSGRVPVNADVVCATPAELNRRMLVGEIDLGPVSAFWYAENRDTLRLLPQLSISSESGVQSVLLFSRKPLAEIGGRRIAVTTEGRTTPVLLEILCRQRHGFTPTLETSASPLSQLDRGADAALVIGDEALESRATLEAAGYRAIDLAEEWRAWTGLPFVFAVWAVRRDVFESRADEVLEAWRALLRSKAWGIENRGEVLAEAGRRVSLERPDLEKYFSRLRYDFDGKLQKGLSLYLEKAAACGLLRYAGELDIVTVSEAVAR